MPLVETTLICCFYIIANYKIEIKQKPLKSGLLRCLAWQKICVVTTCTREFKVIDDVEDFVKSYNYDDSDSMIDYFDTNFYFFGVGVDDCKQVEKTARIKNKATKPAKAENTTPEQEKAQEIENKKAYTYKITKGEDTRDGSELWVVRIAETLDKTAYIEENKRMKERGGYYSKFKKGFIFRFDPSETLKTA